ncbi:YceI family protein [Luteimonas sp. A277]
MTGRAWLLIACFPMLLPFPAGAGGGADLVIEEQSSQVGFVLRTRWGQHLEGVFPSYRGVVVDMPGGERQVRMVLDATSVEIIDQPRHTRLTRGDGFFHVQRWPVVEMQSDPFSPQLLLEGGELGGIVGIRGLRREEVFTILPAACDQPLLDCPVVVEGDISRSDYGMDRWGLALGDRVRFHLSLWAREPDTP